MSDSRTAIVSTGFHRFSVLGVGTKSGVELFATLSIFKSSSLGESYFDTPRKAGRQTPEIRGPSSSKLWTGGSPDITHWKIKHWKGLFQLSTNYFDVSDTACVDGALDEITSSDVVAGEERDADDNIIAGFVNT
ncbi:hypothetical protein KEM54_004482 [Ascosphaera aggregata]|nr:hypothetical protein KEM54_004482 [Ascosphaera aggregata]